MNIGKAGPSNAEEKKIAAREAAKKKQQMLMEKMKMKSKAFVEQN